VACADLYRDGSDANSSAWAATQSGNVFFTTDVAGQDPTVDTDNGLQILDGYFSIPANQMIVGGVNPNITPTGGESFIGGVSASNDWTQGWVYGLTIQNWDQPLWVGQ